MAVSHLTIHALGTKGDGIHSSRRGNVYVDRAVPGDELTARVRTDRMGISRGQIIEVTSASPYRRQPPCPHYEACGNCTLQHVEDNFYREWKTHVVISALQEWNLRPAKMLPSLFLGNASRRRINLTSVKENGTVTLGYFRRRSDEVTEIESCLIAEPSLFELRQPLKQALNLLLQDEQALDLFLQTINGSTELVLTPLTAPFKKPLLKPLENLLRTTALKRIAWRAEYGAPAKVLLEKAKVVAKFGALNVELPPGAFLQATEAGQNALSTVVTDALPATGHFADLFCGCGTFTGPMLARGSVEAFEGETRAIGALNRAGENQRLKGHVRDLVAHPLTSRDLNRFDAVVIDPPRAGALEQMQQIARSKVPVVISVSCNPATFARDARVLCDGGYRFQSVKIVDQFSWSHHIELAGVFRKGGR